MSGSNGHTPQKQASSRRVPGAGNGGIIPPPEHRWKKGQSGNPGGKSAGPTLLSEIRDLLSGKDGKERKEAARAFIAQLKRGSIAHAKEIIEREEGKVPDRLAGADGEAIVVKVIKGVSIDDLR